MMRAFEHSFIRAWSAIIDSAQGRKLTARETLIAMWASLVAPWLLFGAHGARGGIYSDAWSELATQQFVLKGTAADRIAACFEGEALANLPGACVLRHVLYAALGDSGAASSVLGLALFGLVLGTFYVVLRVARLPTLLSGVAVALLLVFQGADALRMWPMISVLVALLVFMAGLLLGVKACHAHVAPAVGILGAGSIIALLIPSTLYQTITPVTILAIPYLWWSSRRRTRGLLIGGIATAGAVVIGYYRAAGSGRVVERDSSGLVSRVGDVLRGATDTWSDAYIGFPMPAPWVAVFVVLTGAVASFLARSGCIGRSQIRSAWALLGAGVLIGALGVAAFFPADDYYVPRPLGLDNRMNVVSQFGYVLIALAFFVFIAVLVANLFARPLAGVATGAVVILIALSTSAIASLRSAQYWADSWATQESVLARVNDLVPTDRSDLTVFTFGHRLYEPNWLPIFVQPWELDSALKVTRNQPDVGGFPISGWSCVNTGLTRTIGAAGVRTPAEVPYAKAVFVRVDQGAVATPQNIGACRRALAAWGTNPVQ